MPFDISDGPSEPLLSFSPDFSSSPLDPLGLDFSTVSETYLKDNLIIPSDWLPPAQRRLPVCNQPVATDPVIVPQQPSFDRSFSFKEILSDALIDGILSWADSSERDHKALLYSASRPGPHQPHRKRAREYSIPQSAIPAKFRGTIWDMRDLEHVVPVVNHPVATNLNLPYLRAFASLTDHPDHRLLTELEYGWFGYSDDLPLVSILSPHHTSLQHVYTATAEELVVEHQKQWHTSHPFPPFFPVRMIPNGSHPKPRTVDKFRRCGDLSHPIIEPPDPTLSVNSHVDIPENEKVPFPRTSDISETVAIFRESGLPVYLLRFDEASAYKQTCMADLERWKQCMAWGGRFLADSRLLYGGAFAPNCYMRFSTLKVPLVRHLLRKHLVISDPRTLSWIADRRRLFPDEPEQWDPFWVSLYIDDYLVAVLGDDLLEQVVAIFHRFEEDTGVSLSWEKYEKEGKPSQRKDMLGIEYDSLSGTRRYPPDKRTWMLDHLEQWRLKDQATPNDLLSLMMRLLWASAVVLYMRPKLNYGFGLLRHGRRYQRQIRLDGTFHYYLDWCRLAIQGWQTVPLVWADEWMKGCVKAWASDSSGHGFGGALQVSPKHWLVFAGAWTELERQWLDINTLELVGVFFAQVLFGSRFHTMRLTFDCDNEASTTVINSGKARGPMAVALHWCQLRWAQLSQLVHAIHIPGVTNTLPDALSRQYWEVVRELTAGCHVTVLPVTGAIRDLSELIAAAREETRLTHRTTTPRVVTTPVHLAL